MRAPFLARILAVQALLLCLSAMPCPGSSATEQALGRLQELTASVHSIRSVFTQMTNVPLFVDPVVSEGIFLFKKPDSLVWEYTAPIVQGLAFSGGAGFRWEGERKNRAPFKTADDPVAGLVATQMLAWIRFDRVWIESQYAVTMADAASGGDVLALTLQPKRPEIRSILTALELRFGEDGIARSIILREATGGTTEIIFHDVAVNAPVDDGEFR